MKILVIRNEPPWPLCYGGRLHCYELVRRLAEQHQLLLVAARSAEAPTATTDHFNFECRVAENGRLYRDRAADEIRLDRWEKYIGIHSGFVGDVLRLAREWQPDVVLGMNYQSLSCLSRIRGVATVCDLQDDEALHNLLEFLHGSSLSKWQTLKAFVAALAYQRKHLRSVDAVVLNSDTDRRFCQWSTWHRSVETLAHGVDCDHYQPVNEPVDENRIVFWGGLSFGPNIGAIRFFAEQVWPLVRRQKPDLRWWIMGRGDSPQLAPYKHLPGVDWLGYVEDIRPCVTQSAVAIVPMKSGAGIKNKIMEAWAMGRPVLCTRRALGDLPGRHGHNVWVANSPRQLAEGLLVLLNDKSLREKIARAGRQAAEKECSWDRAAKKLERICVDAILDKHPIRYNVEPGVPSKKNKEPRVQLTCRGGTRASHRAD